MKKILSILLVCCMAASLLPVSALAESAFIPDDAVTFNGHTYKIFEQALSWNDAKAYCESLGGHLVSITSQEEQDFLTAYSNTLDGSGYIWIGMQRPWEYWVTGEPVTYTNWGYGEPDSWAGQVNGCMLINTEYKGSSYHIAPGEWDDWQGSSAYFLCEWDGTANDPNTTSFGSPVSEWAKEEVEKAYEEDLVPDVLVGKDLKQNITRAEFAAIAVQLYETWTGKTATANVASPFNDISDNENKTEILKAYGLGIVAGISSTTFAPDVLITREQLATMLCRTYKKKEWDNWTLATDDSFTINYSGVQIFDDDADISEYARPSVYFMAKYDVIKGVGNNKFAPKNTTTEQEALGYATATREQAVLMSLRSFENLN